MMLRQLPVLMVCAMALHPNPDSVSSAPSQSDTRPVEVKGPASLTARVGDVLVRIDGPKLWTLSRIEWKSQLLGIEDSAYGTVIGIRDVGWIGTAHFEVEPEQVTHIQFFVNDQSIKVTADEISVGGNKFRMERRSRIRSFELQSALEVRDELIFETLRLRTDQAVDLKTIYPFMYAWNASATDYMFGADDGSRIAGQFLPPPRQTPRHIIEKSVRWASVYDSVSRTGSVSRILALPDQVEASFQFADAPEIYRKLYLMCFTDETVPAEFHGTFGIVTGFFSSQPEHWQDKAAARARELSEVAAQTNGRVSKP
jgi:hypothetical protein